MDLRATAGVDLDALSPDEQARWLAYWQLVRMPELSRLGVWNG
jgi:hypothetical protein